MHIQFVRTGGFAGLRLSTEIDGDSLSPAELQNLREALDTAHFFTLPEQMIDDTVGADRFQYEITVDEGDRQHTIVASESALPEEVQPLVSQLERLARSRRGQ